MLSAILLLALIPLFIVIAIFIYFSLGRPIFFRQARIGLNNTEFNIIKFRTMTDARDQDRKLLGDEERITRVGRLLRRTSLDELPELYNILIGEMSFVGPRPLLTEYMQYYTRRQLARHNVRPGLTGLAQINGRNDLPWEERFELDLKYVNERNFGLDLLIFIRTIRLVVSAEGVTPKGSKVVPRFRGTKGE